MKSNIGHIFNSLFFILALAIFSSCSAWHEAQAVIAEADSLDQNEHVLYSDTTALSQAISTLDNPIGRLLYADQLGKAYYYLGRNFSNEGAIAEAAAQYVEADRLQISDPLYRGRINSCMAHIAKQNESDSLALVFFERSNQAFKESGEDWYYAHTLLDVSEYNAYLHNYHKADSVLQIAQSYALDSFYLARFYETKGLYFYEQLQYDSALYYFHQALHLWEYEEDKFYTYKKLMQVHLDMDDHASALPYAQIIVEQSADPNDLVNAYYCLMQDAKARGDINKLSTYAHARQDANELLMQSVGNYNGAQTLLEEHLANPYPYRWAWITLLCLIVACLLLVIAIVLHRRYATRRLQVAHHQIEDLSISAQLSDIRATYPRPRKQWNDYNELKKDLEPQLHEWLSQLETYQLSNRENVFCTYMLLYPNASLEDLADWMHYSATGVSTFKRRIAQKIGIPTRELYHFLHEMLQGKK
ncbi:MAG: hypothetical protein II248_04630 [Paludibacteraceae bacterium]|nr:hypothetical protein [Paludibacteraceae bacterium]